VKFADTVGGAVKESKPQKPVLTGWQTQVNIEHVVDTPLKRAARELVDGWTPMHKYQEALDLDLIKRAVEQDTTRFEEVEPEYMMPTEPVTGGGYSADHPETAHFVLETLRSINPVLATAYAGGHVDDHHDRLVYNADISYGASPYQGKGLGNLVLEGERYLV
jgi:hypothetical protein